LTLTNRSPSPIAIAPSKKLDLQKKTVPRHFEEESEPIVLDTEFLTPANPTPVTGSNRLEIRGDADLLIADEMPNLQEFARRKMRRNVQSP
jgi:hypothetical protein